MYGCPSKTHTDCSQLDRRNMNDVYPSLDEMARTAINALEAATQDSDKGFFLMIEGSRIDHAGHGNDPAAQVNEVLAYDKAFASVLEFIDRSDTESVVVSTSDHETGGLAIARRKISHFFCSVVQVGSFLRYANSCQNWIRHTLNIYGIQKCSTTPPLLPNMRLDDWLPTWQLEKRM